MKKAVIGLLTIALTSAPAIAKPSLWSYERIDTGLFDIGVAWGVKENCTTLTENRLNGMVFSLGLYNFAKAQGYTHDEVKSFLDSDAEKDKLRQRVTAYFKKQGLNPDERNALCTFGNNEITAKTQVGKLLRKN
ncbi:MAG: DUF5333 domain-containing protein [Pseudomonadota bacterium]